MFTFIRIHTANKPIWGAFFAIGVLLASHSWAAGVTGIVQGSVVDDTGRPVAGANILVSQPPSIVAQHFGPPPVITGPLVATAVANSQGVFSFTGLSAGQYIVCAEVSTPGLLDPCHWASSAPGVTVSAGRISAGVTVTMAKGAVVAIHIEDPLAMLAPVSGSQINSDLQVHAITSKGLHYIASAQASSAVSRDLAVTIPFGAAITLQVRSPHLVVNDLAGNAVTLTGASITVPAGTVLPTISYVVAGSK